ncbi:unnamed protein product [Paramecium sonneborni]|uniref:FH2 domain-containing protein n=1 Tax=Paramecium sonneborni TaxID=65129 RepID=A0A8S1RCV3_9CILI|nr:unnamed protein product [Paramecium sonneborni]
MQFLIRSTAPKLPINLECVLRENKQIIELKITTIHPGPINQQHIDIFLNDVEMTEKDHKRFNSLEPIVKYSIAHQYMTITGQLLNLNLEKTQELLKSNNLFDLACAYYWIMVSGPQETCELIFDSNIDLQGMSLIMYLNCLNQSQQTCSIDLIDKHLKQNDDPEIIYLMLRLLKKHCNSNRQLVEKVILTNLDKLESSLQAKYCFSEFINEYYENFEVTSSFRDLLIANKLEQYLQNPSIIFPYQNQEEQQYPLISKRESKYIYKLDNCDMQQEIELLKQNVGFIIEDEFMVQNEIEKQDGVNIFELKQEINILKRKLAESEKLNLQYEQKISKLEEDKEFLLSELEESKRQINFNSFHSIEKDKQQQQQQLKQTKQQIFLTNKQDLLKATKTTSLKASVNFANIQQNKQQLPQIQQQIENSEINHKNDQIENFDKKIEEVTSEKCLNSEKSIESPKTPLESITPHQCSQASVFGNSFIPPSSPPPPPLPLDKKGVPPPPPPIFGKPGFPPPPPPPPGSIKSQKELKPKFDIIPIEITMKKCQTWNPIPNNKVEGSIWEQFNYDDMKFEIGEFIDIFAAKSIIDQSIMQSGGIFQSMYIKKEPITKLSKGSGPKDPNRAQAIQMALKRVKYPVEEILEAIRIVDEEKLTEDKVTLLIDCLPKENEKNLWKEEKQWDFQEFQQRIGDYSDADKFCMFVMEIKCYEERLISLNAKYESLKNQVVIEELLLMFDAVFDQIKNDQELFTLIRYLFYYGSILNGNNQFYGLRFDSIPKVTCYSDKQKQFDIWMYVIKKIEESGFIIDLDADLSKLDTLSQETRRMDNLFVFLKQFEQNKQQIIMARDSDQGGDDKAKQVFGQLYDEIELFVIVQKANLKNLESKYKELCKMFGESPSKPSDQFIKTIYDIKRKVRERKRILLEQENQKKRRQALDEKRKTIIKK